MWEDYRPPYAVDGGLYAQRYDSNGNALWSQDVFICTNSWAQWSKMISDGASGVIVQANPGGTDYNKHWRIDGQGNILWVRDHLSWWYWGGMKLGEPGYIYLCFNYNDGLYGQRVNINGGVNSWPTWGSGQAGALLYQIPAGFNFFPEYALNLSYNYPYFYGIHAPCRGGTTFYPSYYRINGLDSLGNRLWGDNGILLYYNDTIRITDGYLVPDSNYGIAAVFQMSGGNNLFDVYAKRINNDGTLGGPNAPLNEVTITVSGMDLTLNWPSQALGAEYFLRFSDNPYVFPALADTTISDTVFVDVNGVLEGVKFYEVRWQP